jgi:4-hydroxybenzoate polyprenyltransferase
MGFYAASIAVMLACWRLAGLGVLFLPIAALAAAQLAWQALRLRLNDPRRALGLFKSNTLAGGLIFTALVAGHWR